MDEHPVDNDSRLPLDQRFSGGCVNGQADHVISRWIVDSPRQQQRIVKRHRGHWVSGPSALMASYLRPQDLSASLFPLLRLPTAGPMGLASTRTMLMSQWNTGHWVSGPPALIIDHQLLHRPQSG